MSEEFFLRLQNLLKMSVKDNAGKSEYLQGIRVGIRLALRAWYQTYADQKFKQIELEVFENEN